MWDKDITKLLAVMLKSLQIQTLVPGHRAKPETAAQVPLFASLGMRTCFTEGKVIKCQHLHPTDTANQLLDVCHQSINIKVDRIPLKYA